jgi:hypothetical protein|tara:strand:- start:2643 stop:3689 length:1047 start_codon:yes stop_codon:yes gene_type:complete
MTNTIRNADKDFDFNKLHLGNPHSLQGGSYFSKILFGPTDEPVYIQTPKCKCNKGIVKTGKKEYIDLLLTNDNSNFVEWMNHLEESIQGLIYNKRQSWFANQEELSLDDIQSFFTPPIKVYKGTNFLVRCHIPSTKGIVSTLNIFDERQSPKDKEDVTEQCDMISIIEIQGLRFSHKSFQIDINVKQIMLFSTNELFTSCLITTSTKEEKPINVLLDNSDTEDNISKEDNINDKGTEKEDSLDVPEIDKSNIKINLEEKLSNDGLEEIDLEDSGLQNVETLTLKKPDEIYYEMYKQAKQKARELRKEALEAFLKAKQIKNKYSLEESEEEEDEEEDSEEEELNYLIDS